MVVNAYASLYCRLMRYLGIDSSLTATGLCLIDLATPTPGYPDPGEPHLSVQTATVRAPKAKVGDKSALTTSTRIAFIIDTIAAVIVTSPPDVIGLEDVPQGVKGTANKLHWLWGRIVDLARLYDIPLITVHNTAVKTFATGKGNSEKDVVMLAVANRYPHIPVRNNNEADAVMVAMLVARQQGHPIDTMPKDHMRALDNGKVVLHT